MGVKQPTHNEVTISQATVELVYCILTEQELLHTFIETWCSRTVEEEITTCKDIEERNELKVQVYLLTSDVRKKSPNDTQVTNSQLKVTSNPIKILIELREQNRFFTIPLTPTIFSKFSVRR